MNVVFISSTFCKSGSDSGVDMPPLACFSSAGKTVTLEEIKGLLLVSAEQTVNSMCDNILMKVSDKKQGKMIQEKCVCRLMPLVGGISLNTR